MCFAICIYMLLVIEVACIPFGKFKPVIFTNTTKLWFHYTRHLLKNLVERAQNQSSVQSLAFIFFERIIAVKKNCAFLVITPKTDFQLVKKASGYFHHQFTSTVALPKDCTALSNKRKVQGCHFPNVLRKFDVDPSLSVNLTFHKVNFSPPLCHQAHLSVETSRRFFFCGYQSTFDFCGGESVIFVRAFISPCTLFEILFAYQVKERYHTISLQYEELPQFISQFSVRPSFRLYVYNVVVKKTCGITMSSTSGDISVFDGPSVYHTTLVAAQDTYKSSTFQVTVIENQVGIPSPLPVVFAAFQLPSRNINLNSTTYGTIFTFASSLYLFNSFLLLLNTGIKQVNMTILNIAFSGPKRKECPDGGLAFADFWEQKYFADENSFCSDDFGENIFQRHHLALNGSMVVFYWYDNHSSINATLSFLLTHCKPVNICPCTFTILCVYSDGNMADCVSYIKGLTHSQSYIKLDAFHEERESSLYLRYRTISTSCFVFQVAENDSFFRRFARSHVKQHLWFFVPLPDLCDLTLARDPFFFAQESEHYHDSMGSMKTFPIHTYSQDFPENSKKCVLLTQIQFKGKSKLVLPVQKTAKDQCFHWTSTSFALKPSAHCLGTPFHVLSRYIARRWSWQSEIVTISHLTHQHFWFSMKVYKKPR